MVDRLWVMWRDAQDSRHTIGQLWRDAGVFHFAYELALPPAFRTLVEFPKLRTAADPYRSPYLFPTFAERIPSPRRPDYAAILDGWGVVDRDDPFEALAKSGGIQVTDRFELSEWRADDDALEAPLLVRVAGGQSHPGAADAEVGDTVSFSREADNTFDPHATRIVLAVHGKPLGYVPKPYTALVARLLDGGVELCGDVVWRLGVPQSYGRWLVEVRRAGAPRQTARFPAK